LGIFRCRQKAAQRSLKAIFHQDAKYEGVRPINIYLLRLVFILMFIMRERTLGRTLSRTSCLFTGLSSRYSIHSNGTAHNTMIQVAGGAELPQRRCGHNVMSRSCSVTRRNKFVCDESLSNSTENYDYQGQRATAFVHMPAAKLQRCDFPFPIVSRLY
jgi:hypothetical protein